jgi:hypothetical protein
VCGCVGVGVGVGVSLCGWVDGCICVGVGVGAGVCIIYQIGNRKKELKEYPEEIIQLQRASNIKKSLNVWLGKADIDIMFQTFN